MINSFIKKKTYLDIIKVTTLTAVDLIIVHSNNILLGYRKNDPAKNYWFVPGCRTRKNERINEGLKRVAYSELGLDINFKDVKLIGVYDHIYENNFDNHDFGTHYLVNAFLYIVNERPELKIDDQHEEMKWFSFEEVKKNKDIHQYTKDYLQNVLQFIKK
jgi:colanic acid biosynthesis protein WcaH